MAYDTVAVTTGDHITQKEAIANGAITPGQLIMRQSTGKVVVHNVSGGSLTAIKIAVEDDLQGNGIDDAYAATGSSTRCLFHIPKPGDEYYMLLADGQTAVIGSKLESNGDGDLKVFTEDTWAEAIGADSSAAVASGTIYQRQIVGEALEALDLSGSSGADPSSRRILVEIVG